MMVSGDTSKEELDDNVTQIIENIEVESFMESKTEIENLPENDRYRY